jgi:predicted amidophosphoribosyltransferase
MPVNDRLCWRTKATTAQTKLGKADRQKNLAAAFAVDPAIARYQHVAIFDDVVTTGATVGALVLALKSAGVERVDIWCICRA